LRFEWVLSKRMTCKSHVIRNLFQFQLRIVKNPILALFYRFRKTNKEITFFFNLPGFYQVSWCDDFSRIKNAVKFDEIVVQVLYFCIYDNLRIPVYFVLAIWLPTSLLFFFFFLFRIFKWAIFLSVQLAIFFFKSSTLIWFHGLKFQYFNVNFTFPASVIS